MSSYLTCYRILFLLFSFLSFFFLEKFKFRRILRMIHLWMNHLLKKWLWGLRSHVDQLDHSCWKLMNCKLFSLHYSVLGWIIFIYLFIFPFCRFPLWLFVITGMYKNQLQELAQRSCFNLPSYACIREGPDHAPRFKATVNFNGEVFESPTFCNTLRQAEHAAAEVALNVLSKNGPSKALAAKVLVRI